MFFFFVIQSILMGIYEYCPIKVLKIRSNTKMKCNLKWVNIYSNETGYVGKVSKKEGHFVSSPDKAGAKTYVSEKAANKEIELLASMGEAENNRFEIEEA